MPLISTPSEDGTVTHSFVCGRNLKSCYRCNRLARYQCDYILARTKTGQKLCDRWLCEIHRTPLQPEKDACPEHAAICLEAMARQLRRAQGYWRAGDPIPEDGKFLVRLAGGLCRWYPDEASADAASKAVR